MPNPRDRRLLLEDDGYRVVPKNLIITPGPLFQDFETTTGWTAVAGSIANNTSQYMEGTQSIKLTSVAGGTGIMVKTINNVLSGYMRVAVYLHDDPTIKAVTLSVASVADFSVRKSVTLTCTRQNAWHVFNLIPTDWATVGGESWSNTMIGIRFFQAASPPAESCNMSFDNLHIDSVGMPGAAFLFSDVNTGAYDYALLHSLRRDFVFSWYVTTGAVSTPTKVTWAQLQEMQYTGHVHIGHHTQTHVDLTSLPNQAAMEAEIQAAYDDLDAHNLGIYKHDFLPVGNNYNATMRLAMIAKNTRIAHIGTYGAVTKFSILPCDLLTTPQFIFLTNTVSLANAESYVDTAIARGELICFLGDNLVAGVPGAAQWNAQDWMDLVDYVIDHNMPILCSNDIYNLSRGPVEVRYLKF